MNLFLGIKTASGMYVLQRCRMRPDIPCAKAFQYRKRYVRVATDKVRFKKEDSNVKFQYRKRYVRVATEWLRRWHSGRDKVSIPQAVCTCCNFGVKAYASSAIEVFQFQYRKRYVRVATEATLKAKGYDPISFNTASGMYVLQRGWR